MVDAVEDEVGSGHVARLDLGELERLGRVALADDHAGPIVAERVAKV